MLNREPMWLKYTQTGAAETASAYVSVLNREPMWLKSFGCPIVWPGWASFSAQP